MFLPTTQEELHKLKWDTLDIILISGDSYIDSSFIGISVIGKVLLRAGYRVGVIAQPDISSGKDITRLGEARLFWGVTGGSSDSLVANYTATKKRRNRDDFTPGGVNKARPDRAVIVYTNLIRKYFKNTTPILLGGIEASTRRIAHYDFYSDSIRRSILFDAKASILVYGMGEKTIIECAEKLKREEDFRNIPGICYISKEKKEHYCELPPFECVSENKHAFIEMFHLFYRNNNPLCAQGLYQKHGDRYLIHNPPAPYLTQHELDEVYEMDFERDVHPFYRREGPVKAVDTIKFSLTTHRGCYGECNFCSIAIHQGSTIRWRSQKSIVKEATRLTRYPDFKGHILDVGGPTANMYGFECKKKLTRGKCAERRCLYPDICSRLPVSHKKQIELLKNLQRVKGVKKVTVASGIRYDLLLKDKKHGIVYLREVVHHHVSGQMKIAPEHTEERVLKRMGKPGKEPLLLFKDLFYRLTKEARKKQFLTYYFLAAHPGCTGSDMMKLRLIASKELKINPRQIQIFTPTPSTYSTLMYYTGIDPFSDETIFIEKNSMKKERQKNMLAVEVKHNSGRSGY
ncbi:MAG: YgiQ family radical SAM protein [bacterium]